MAQFATLHLVSCDKLLIFISIELTSRGASDFFFAVALVLSNLGVLAKNAEEVDFHAASTTFAPML